jgi:hypothetical protein
VVGSSRPSPQPFPASGRGGKTRQSSTCGYFSLSRWRERVGVRVLVLATALPTAALAQRQPAAAPSLPPPAAAPTDRADIDRTAIVGNRELPKVLYIVPWKKPLPATLSGRPVVSVIDEALAPVDRDVFRRHMQYDQQLRSLDTTAPKTNPESKP